MRWVLWAVSIVAASGCGSTLPAPSIVSITPAETEQGTAPQVSLDVHAVYPFSVDYGSKSSTVDPAVTVRVGGVPLSNAVVQPDGSVTGQVPFSLAPAVHDVTLELADGRSATLAGGFTVKPGAFPDSFTIDQIPAQRRNQPFSITIHGVGGRASEFKGVVQFSVPRGIITPTQSGAFTAGVLTETVSINRADAAMTITVTDAEGHTGKSNAFLIFP